MRKTVFILLISVLFAACAPVLNRELMQEAMRGVPLSVVRANPDPYKGKLFILGGIIVETKFTATGSQIETLQVPVDSRGYLQDVKQSQGRFLALYPRSEGLLDPVVYKSGRQITLAGEFLELRKGKIDEMEYLYPVFAIRQVYLWDELSNYGYYPAYYPWSYPYAYPYGWYGGPGWGPYPYGYPYYYWPPQYPR